MSGRQQQQQQQPLLEIDPEWGGPSAHTFRHCRVLDDATAAAAAAAVSCVCPKLVQLAETAYSAVFAAGATAPSSVRDAVGGLESARAVIVDGGVVAPLCNRQQRRAAKAEDTALRALEAAATSTDIAAARLA